MVAMSVEGTIRIIRLDDAAQGGEGTYSVRFSPYDRGGGAQPMRQFLGSESLLSFLENGLCIDKRDVAAACRDLDERKPASIPHVVLTYYDLVRSGLA